MIDPVALRALTDFSPDERSLLLFFETAAVDHGGALNTAHMNDADYEIAKQWVSGGFIEFGRIAARSLEIFKHSGRTHYVVLSPEAVLLAQEERRARIERLAKKRSWKKAGERDDP